MKFEAFPFQTLDWTTIAKEEHQGINGTAYWQIFMMNEINIGTYHSVIAKCIQSCSTPEQLQVAHHMIENFADYYNAAQMHRKTLNDFTVDLYKIYVKKHSQLIIV